MQNSYFADMSHTGENILGLESISFIIRLLKRPSLKILILIFSEFPLPWRKHTEPVLQKHKGSPLSINSMQVLVTQL